MSRVVPALTHLARQVSIQLILKAVHAIRTRRSIRSKAIHYYRLDWDGEPEPLAVTEAALHYLEQTGFVERAKAGSPTVWRRHTATDAGPINRAFPFRPMCLPRIGPLPPANEDALGRASWCGRHLFAFAQHGLEGVRSDRPAEIKSLKFVAAVLAQEAQLALHFDPFGHHP